MTFEASLMRHAGKTMAPLFSACALALLQPWMGATGLAWIALAPLFLYVSLAPLTLRRFALVLAALFLYSLAIAYPYMHIDGAWWSGVNGLAGLLSENVQYASIMFMAALLRVIAFLPIVLLARPALSQAFGPLLLSLAWAWSEWGFSAIFLSRYSAGALGYNLADVPFLSDIASLPPGVFLLSALIVYGNAFLAQALLRRHAQARLPSSARQVGEALLFVSVIGFSFCYGFVYEHTKRWQEAPLTVAIIATPLSTEDSITEYGYRAYRKEILRALASSPDLILLPENAFPYFELDEARGALRSDSLVNFPNRDALYFDLLSLSRAHPTTTLVIGMHTHRDDKRFNSLVLMKNGTTTSFYQKRALVPFAEYAPLGLSLSLAVRFANGEERQQMRIDGRAVDARICSEIGVFGRDSHAAHLILVASNDSVFEGDLAATMHQTMARMRAIESDAYVVRADKGGISSVIDPYGRVATSTKEGVVTATIYP